MIRVAIIGAAGLSGLELIQWLKKHPHVELKILTSSKYQGQSLESVFPQFLGMPQTFEHHDTSLEGCDLAFLATPNKASLDLVPKILEQGIRVIDLSGVYRLTNVDVFEKYYSLTHTSPELLKEVAFGLPEYFKEKIANARLVANPGCYPTGSLLGVLPFAEFFDHLVSSPVFDAKSGVSGAGGRVEDDTTNYVSVNENFKAYKVFGHQHLPEIQEHLENLTTFDSATLGQVIFTPHLLPITRGILTTCYLRFNEAVPANKVRQHFKEVAEKNAFFHVMPEGQLPELNMVQHTNHCYVGLSHDDSQKNWIAITAIDNLLKGASGQAIQNMNLMFKLEETTGLL